MIVGHFLNKWIVLQPLYESYMVNKYYSTYNFRIQLANILLKTVQFMFTGDIAL